MYVASGFGEFGEEAAKAKKIGRTIDNHANEKKEKDKSRL